MKPPQGGSGAILSPDQQPLLLEIFKLREQLKQRRARMKTEVGKARVAALEEAISAIDDAFEKDLDTAPQDVLRALIERGPA